MYKVGPSILLARKNGSDQTDVAASVATGSLGRASDGGLIEMMVPRAS